MLLDIVSERPKDEFTNLSYGKSIIPMTVAQNEQNEDLVQAL